MIAGEGMLENSAILSLISVVSIGLVSLLLAAGAQRLLKYEQEQAHIRKEIFGVEISIVGSVAAWLGSFIIMNWVWLYWSWPIFEQTLVRDEAWTVHGNVSYERYGEFVSATNDVEIAMLPKQYRLTDGVFTMKVLADRSDPKEMRWPAFQFKKTTCHEPVIRSHSHELATINEADRRIDLGEIKLVLRKTNRTLSVDGQESKQSRICQGLYGN
jgi:hypothetical protein